jgi:HEAT repeat protein
MISPDGRLVFTQDNRPALKVWDVASTTATEGWVRKSPHLRYCVFLPTVFSSDGKLALSVTSRQSLSLWEVDSGKEVREYKGLHNVRSLALSADGRLAAAGSWSGDIQVLPLPDGENVQRLGLTGTGTAMFFSPDGKQLVIKCPGCLKVWDIEAGKAVRSFEGSADQSLLALSRDGKWALTARTSGASKPPYPLALWDVARGKQIRQFVGHELYVHYGTFTGGGEGIVSAGSDGTLKRWDTATGKLLWSKPLSGEESRPMVMAFSPDGKLLLSANWYGTIKLWDAEQGKLLRLLEARKAYEAVKDPGVVPALSALLQSADARVRRNAAEDLGKVDEEAAPTLIGALADEDASVRQAAAASLGRIGQGIPRAKEALMEALDDRDVRVSIAAAAALFVISKQHTGEDPVPESALAALSKALRSSEVEIRIAAVEALRLGGPQAALALCTALRDRDPKVRGLAATWIWCPHWPGPARDAVIAAFREALGDSENRVRVRAAMYLWSLETGDTARVVRVARRALRDADAQVRRWAVTLLKDVSSSSREAAAPAVPDLTDALRDRDNAVRIEAALTLRNQGCPARLIIPALIEALKDDDHVLCRGAADALGLFGPEAGAAIGQLVSVLKENGEASLSASEALAKIGPAAVPALAELVRGRDPGIRTLGVLALWHMGPGASGAASALVEAMNDLKDGTGFDRRDFAAEALGRIGPRAGPAVVPALVAVIRNRQELARFRRACVETLRLLGAVAVDAIPALTEVQDDPAVSELAAAALKKIKIRAAVERIRLP